MVVKMTVKGDVKAAARLKRVKKLPQLTREAMRKWGNILVRDMKQSARDAGIQSDTGVLLGYGTRWEQAPQGNTGVLMMPEYGAQLDGMSPHWVSVSQRRQRLLAWAARHNFTAAHQIYAGERRKFSIFVRPHPFILNGWRRARRKLPVLLRQAAKQATGA